MSRATVLEGLTALALLIACNPGPPAPGASSRVGELVCAEGYCPADLCDSASAEYPSHLPMPACPVMVVEVRAHGMDGKDTALRIAGPFGLHGWVAAGVVLSHGRARAADSLLGATDEVYAGESGFLGLRFPSRKNPYHQVGLIFGGGESGNVGGRPDTVAFVEGPGMRTNPGSPTPTMASCLETIRNSQDFGLTHAPLLQVENCSLETAGYWVVKEDSGSSSSWVNERAVCKGVEMVYRGKVDTSRSPVFLKLDCGIWLFSDRPGSETLVKFSSSAADPEGPSEEDIVHVTGVEPADLDADGRQEWLVETSRIYGDGSYRHLVILSSSRAGGPDSGSRGILHSKVIGFGGASGEPGGSAVEGAWWVAKSSGKGRRVYIAEAEAGNEDGPSRDLSLAAYGLAADGSMRQAADKAFEVVFLGGPVQALAAERKAYEIRGKHPAAREAGVLILPWRDGDDLLWRVGFLLGGRDDILNYSSWSNSAELERIPAR